MYRYDNRTRILEVSDCSALHSDYGYAIAYSVSFLQKFVRPVGDALTNETVREVIEHQSGFADKFLTIHGKLATLTEDVYTLVSLFLESQLAILLWMIYNAIQVKGYSNIYTCALPGLPLADTNTVLNPRAPPLVSHHCKPLCYVVLS